LSNFNKYLIRLKRLFNLLINLFIIYLFLFRQIIDTFVQNGLFRRNWKTSRNLVYQRRWRMHTRLRSCMRVSVITTVRIRSSRSTRARLSGRCAWISCLDLLNLWEVITNGYKDQKMCCFWSVVVANGHTGQQDIGVWTGM
jgi:hypothetical protein